MFKLVSIYVLAISKYGRERGGREGERGGRVEREVEERGEREKGSVREKRRKG